MGSWFGESVGMIDGALESSLWDFALGRTFLFVRFFIVPNVHMRYGLPYIEQLDARIRVGLKRFELCLSATAPCTRSSLRGGRGGRGVRGERPTYVVRRVKV